MEAQECRAGGSVTAALEELGRRLTKSLLCCTLARFNFCASQLAHLLHNASEGICPRAGAPADG